jgi:hypothetical protein
MATISNSDGWRTRHLFVLVGGNPLPNLVAGKLLLAQGGTLHLLHSADTADVAGRIAAHFSQPKTHELKDPADGAEIQAVVKEAVLQCRDGSVGLHYTGGTKAMAVNAHHAVTKAYPTAVLTYLDARQMMLFRTDVEGKCPAQYGVSPPLALEDLLKLHGIDLDVRHPVRREPRREKLNQTLACAHTTAAGQEAYELWCRRYLRRAKSKDARKCRKLLADELGDELAALAAAPDQLYSRVIFAVRGTPCCGGDLVDDLKDFPVCPIPYPVDPALHEVVEVMQETFGGDGPIFDPAAVIANPAVGLNSIKDLTHYLDGDWMEHLTLAAFVAHQSTHRLHDWGMSLRTTTEPYDFEFDVAAMQGYQLYAVSCTRSADKSICKSKLFEAYVRAAQLGGDEAKVGLVCCNSSSANLQRQVQEFWRANKGRIRVFGPDDITRLPERFDDWLSSR